MKVIASLCTRLVTGVLLVCCLCRANPITTTTTSTSTSTASTTAVDDNLPRWSCTLATRSDVYEGMSPLRTAVYSEETWCQDHLHDYTASGGTEVPTASGSDIRHSKITTCKGDEKCLPIVSIRKEFNLFTGLQRKLVPHRCGCFSEEEPCRAVRHSQHFFPNTPYSQRIDTRRCIGSCTSGQGACRAVKNHTVTIPGPNGDLCVTVTDECACATSCFRSSYNMVFSEQLTDLETGKKTEQPKIIDVGRCTGSCREQVLDMCIRKHNATGPLLDLRRLICNGRKADHSCVPGSVSVVNFTNTKGNDQAVPVIDSCICKTLTSGLDEGLFS